MKKVLITGGTGFVGTNVVHYLSKFEDYSITATYHTSEPCYPIYNVDYVEVDLSNTLECIHIMENIDYVIMTAASVGGIVDMCNDPLALINDSSRININCLEAAYKCGVKKCVFISSGAVYPFMEGKAEESMAFMGDPIDKYYMLGWAKRFGELLCRMYSTKVNNPISCTVLRIDNVYGPYDSFEGTKAHVIPSLIRKVVNNDFPLVMWGDGLEQKDFMYIDDLLVVIKMALDELDGYHDYNVITGINTSLNDALGMILKIANKTDTVVKHDLTKPTSISCRNLSNQKLYKDLEFCPSTKLYDGLQKTIAWYKNNIMGD